jgi:ribosome-associated translation inhibitor RaiA
MTDGAPLETMPTEVAFMLQIHFLDMGRSDAIEDRVRRWADRLAQKSDEIQNCQVWIAAPHGHHRKGYLYSVRIRLTVPGEEIAVELQPAQEDVHLSIRKAFEAARRKLEDYERRRRGKVKAHPRASGDRSRRRLIPARFERV